MKLRRFTAAALTMMLLNSTGFALRSNAEQGTISLGDLNADGYVDAVDASTVLAAYACISTEQDTGLSPEQLKAADVNDDGIVDAVDASNILAYYAYTSTGGTKDIESFMNADEPVTEKITYTTKMGEIYMVSCPTFQFDYPDNWLITTEEYDALGTTFHERVILTNERGATITYMAIAEPHSEGRMMFEFEVSKAADSDFIPGYAIGTGTDFSYLGDFMVAEIKQTGVLFMDTETEFHPVEGNSKYAVLPESYIGTHHAVGLFGIYSEFSFTYPSNYAFIAIPGEDGFTPEEKDEVISILSSFRSINY